MRIFLFSVQLASSLPLLSVLGYFNYLNQLGTLKLLAKVHKTISLSQHCNAQITIKFLHCFILSTDARICIAVVTTDNQFHHADQNVSGDLLDEGKWCGDSEFQEHVERFNTMFSVPSGTQRHLVVGNHDIGFHYMSVGLLVMLFSSGDGGGGGG